MIKPSKEQIEKYLKMWNSTEKDFLTDDSLNNLFINTYPLNNNIYEILIKVASLDEFYSTSLYYPLDMAKHILKLNIDNRLKNNDITLVNDIASIKLPNGKKKYCYSFATKYCSHHNQNEYPIYDSYVEKVLVYLKNKDKFAQFKVKDLKNYEIFKSVLLAFRQFYHLEEYSLKDIDKYVWKMGKEEFGKY